MLLKAANALLLRDAIVKDLGATVYEWTSTTGVYDFNIDGYRCRISNGQLTVQASRPLSLAQQTALANKVNRAYSRTVLKTMGVKKGWKVEAIADRSKTAGSETRKLKASKKSTSSQIAVDAMEYEILEDGTVKTTTPTISTPNHSNADALLAGIDTLLGGRAKIVSKKKEAAMTTQIKEQVRVQE